MASESANGKDDDEQIDNPGTEWEKKGKDREGTERRG